MAQTIYGPDGIPHDFPDGMSDADMAAAMAGEYPTGPGTAASATPASGTPQMSGMGRYPALIGQGLVKGAAQLAGLPGDVFSLASRGLSALGLPAPTGMPPDYPGAASSGVDWSQANTHALPTSSDLMAATKALGLTDSASLQPQNLTERLVAGTSQGLGGALPAIALTGGAAAPVMLASGAAGGLAGAVTDELAPSTPLWLKAAISGGAGIAGGGTAGMAQRMMSAATAQSALEAAQKAVPALEGEVTAAAQAKRDTAMQMQDLTRSAGAAADQHVQQATSDALQSQALAQQQAEADRQAVIAAHGGPVDYETAGLQAQQDARRMIQGTGPTDPPGTIAAPDTLPGIRQALMDQITSVVSDDHPVPIGNYQARLRDLQTQAGPLQGEVDRLTSGLPRELDALNTQRNEANAATETLTGEPAPPPSWSDVSAAKTAVGRLIGTPALNKSGLSPEELRGLYQGLSEDQRQSLAHLQLPDGSTGADLLDGTNYSLNLLHQFENGPLSKLVSAGTATEGDSLPGKAVASLLGDAKTDGTDLGMLRQFMPGTTDRLLAAHLSQAPEAWQGLSASAKANLVNDPVHAQTLDDAAASVAQAEADTRGAQAAASDHADSITDAAEQQKFQSQRDATIRLQQAQAALKAHKKTLPALAEAAATPTSSELAAVRLGRISDSLGGLGLGTLAGAGAHALGLGDVISGPAIGAGIGLTAPALRAGIPFVAKNPLVPFVGSAGTINVPDVSVSSGKQ